MPHASVNFTGLSLGPVPKDNAGTVPTWIGVAMAGNGAVMMHGYGLMLQDLRAARVFIRMPKADLSSSSLGGNSRIRGLGTVPLEASSRRSSERRSESGMPGVMASTTLPDFASEIAVKASAEPTRDEMATAPPAVRPGGVKCDAKSSNASFIIIDYNIFGLYGKPQMSGMLHGEMVYGKIMPMNDTSKDSRIIRVPEVVIERVAGAVGSCRLSNASIASKETIAATGFAEHCVAAEGEDLFDLSLRAAKIVMEGVSSGDVGGVVAATFSNAMRFPGLAVKLAGALGLESTVPALDLQLACSAYPYAIYVAGRIAADTGKKVLVLDGDLQSALTDMSDASTAPLFSDASTATLLSCRFGGADQREPVSEFGFLSRAADALVCSAQGPIRMDGFKVFSFVATDVVRFLRGFGSGFDVFVPHQANMYMVRQLAKSLALEDKLVTCGEEYANPGSSSIPLALALHGRPGRALIAGFGAGLSASAATIRLAPDACRGLA